MVFSNPINIATATMEQIYERLCRIYSALRSTVVYDAIGSSYPHATDSLMQRPSQSLY